MQYKQKCFIIIVVHSTCNYNDINNEDDINNNDDDDFDDDDDVDDDNNNYRDSIAK